MMAALGTVRHTCASYPAYNPRNPSCFQTLLKDETIDAYSFPSVRSRIRVRTTSWGYVNVVAMSFARAAVPNNVSFDGSSLCLYRPRFSMS